MAYDIKYRKRAVEYRKEGHTIEETSQIFSIAQSTLKKWIILHEAGNLSDPKRKECIRKIDPERLKEFVAENPDCYQYEIAQHIECCCKIRLIGSV